MTVEQLKVMKRAMHAHTHTHKNHCLKEETQGGLSKAEGRSREKEGVNLASPLALLFHGKLLHEELIKPVSTAEKAGN